MHDPVSLFFLACFLVGAALSFISLFAGFAHLPVHGGHLLHVGHAGRVASTHNGSESASPFNAGTVLAFVAWFGGVGYLLRTLSLLPFLFVLLLSLLAGLAGATLIALFLIKVLVPAQTVVDPERYRMDGTQAHVTASIMSGGVGEVTYSKAGTRRSDAARSLDGEPIARGTDVVIVSYQRGIAYVSPTETYLRTPAREMIDRLAALDSPREAPGNSGTQHRGTTSEGSGSQSRRA